MKDLMEEMVNDRSAKEDLLRKVSNAELEGVARLAAEAARHQEEIVHLEKRIKEEKASWRKIVDDELPNALESMGMEKFTLKDGSEISVSQMYFASIPKNRREEAFAWLRENHHGDIIKTAVAVAFGKGEDEQAQFLIEKIGQAGFSPTQTTKIEPMTLKGWLRERVENGEAIPLDLFGGHITTRATIKKGKN